MNKVTAEDNRYIKLMMHCIGLDHKKQSHTKDMESYSLGHTVIIIAQAPETARIGS